MNKIIRSLIKEVVQIEISGKKLINGTLIDLGSDVLVLFNGTDYVYIPTNHIQCLTINRTGDFEVKIPAELPSIITENNDKEEDLSIIKVLTEAQEEFVQIYVTGSQTLHGKIISIKDDYFVFYSPIYKMIYIPLNHFKWLIPYSKNKKPYGLGDNFLLQSNNEVLASVFEIQVENLKNKLVMFNMGGKISHIGKISNIDNQIVEIQTAKYPVYLNLTHIKTLHQV